MTTRTIMKARIASELRRDDLTSDITDAISSAIAQYSSSIQYFNGSRANTFNTVADQYHYVSTDTGCSFFSRIIQINYVLAIVSGQPIILDVRDIRDLEWTNLTSGNSAWQPTEYAWFGQEIHINRPNDVYSIRVGAQLSIAEPATDGETGNIWMTDCERAVRAFTKAELYSHVIMDTQKAQVFYDIAKSAWEKIERKTEQLAMSEGGKVVPFSM